MVFEGVTVVEVSVRVEEVSFEEEMASSGVVVVMVGGVWVVTVGGGRGVMVGG